MARRQKARPQCLCPHPRGVRGEAESADRGDEGRDRGGAAAEGSGGRQWPASGGKERKVGEEGEVNRPEYQVIGTQGGETFPKYE